MNEILEFVLIGVAVLSLIPVLHLFNTPRSVKYRYLKFLVNATFAWTILIFIERISTNQDIIYYSHMLGYPLKFLMAVFTLCTIYNYIEKKLPKWMLVGFAVIFFVDYLVAITNAQTKFILDLTPAQTLSYDSLYTATNGPLFIIHLLLTYSVLLIAIGYLILFLRKKNNIRQYKSVTKTMAFSVVIVIVFNALQMTLIKTNVDLTYVSLVIVTFMLYEVIYSKDMIFNLKTSGRGEILSNMREMYILTDYDKHVVEISKLLQEKYDLDALQYEGKSLSILLENLKKQIVIYEDYNVDEESINAKKDHFHLREKKFSLNKMDEYGYMILMYDETQVFKLLRELNKLSNYDNMTGLHNRNYIEDKIKEYKDITAVGVVSLDLNGLKTNNDYLGHERGDYLLKQLANKMKQIMIDYEEAEMARIGGDEFLIILSNTNKDILEQIRIDLLSLCYSDNIEEKISVSIGIAYDNSENTNIFELIQNADKDMYQMKKLTSKEYSKEIVLYANQNDKYIR